MQWNLVVLGTGLLLLGIGELIGFYIGQYMPQGIFGVQVTSELYILFTAIGFALFGVALLAYGLRK
ncbi:MAG: hypothetical protein ACE5KD_00590 [Candidatus Bathyarchaeia archaeon]